MNANIQEIFYSIQGEGRYVGLPMVFVRFTGCNLDCWYCDTKRALTPAKTCLVETIPFSGKYEKYPNNLTIDQTITIIKKLPNTTWISFTGGEPLLQATFIAKCIKKFPKRKFLIETNGTLSAPLTELSTYKNIVYSVDCKKDHEKEFGLFTKTLNKQNQDWYTKIVLEKDLNWEKIIPVINIPENTVYIQPVSGKVTKKILSNTIRQLNSIPIIFYFIPQIHKYLKIN